MDDKAWQLEVSEKLGGIAEKLKLLDAINEKLAGQNTRIRDLEATYQRGRGVLAVLGFMGVAGVLGFLGWIAKLGGVLR